MAFTSTPAFGSHLTRPMDRQSSGVTLSQVDLEQCLNLADIADEHVPSPSTTFSVHQYFQYILVLAIVGGKQMQNA